MLGKLRNVHHFFVPHPRNNYHPHLFRARSLSVIGIVAIGVKLLLLAGLSIAIPSQEAFAEVVVSDIVSLTNQARASAGADPVTLQENLNQAARLKAQDMLKQQYFDHYGPNGETPWQWFHAAGYRYTYAGENLASNFTDAESLHQAWMNSPTHRENIVNSNYRDMGLAVATGELNGHRTTIVVQMFGATSIPPATVSGESIVVNDVTDTANEEVFAEGSLIVSPETITSEFVAPTSTPFWVAAWSVVREFYVIIAGVLSLLLLVMIGVKLEIQHHRAIASAFAVLGVLLALASIELHFLEGVSGVIEIL